MGDINSIKDLQFAEYNPRYIDKHDFASLKNSMGKFGDLSGVVRNVFTGNLVCGHQRIRALLDGIGANAEVEYLEQNEQPDKYGTMAVGFIQIPGSDLKFAYREVNWTVGTEMAANVVANRAQGAFDVDKLAKVTYELSQLPDGADLVRLTGQRDDEIKKLMESIGVAEPEPAHAQLTDTFVVPPFSILDTKQGYWQDRRRYWLDMGIKSELGRDEGLLSSRDNLVTDINGGTSVFDPVLCEVAYRWFGLPGCTVLDPFAGGSVRGILASKLGHTYVGVELSGRQIEANREQAGTICDDPIPVWIEGDSQNLANLVGADLKADLIFSCPPYADLEVYSDNPQDLSTMEYPAFLKAYYDIIVASYNQLKDNRFAVFVVGEVRAKNGEYYNFVGDTIEAFKKAGFHYYNEMILVNSAGTLPQRVGRSMRNRKVGKQHQNVLVFYKGDVTVIQDTYPELVPGKDFEQEPEAEDTAAVA